MKIKAAQYDAVVRRMTSRECLGDLANESKISYNTLLSIYSQQYQLNMRKHHRAHQKKKEEYYSEFVNRCKSSEDGLVAIAEEYQIAPCLLARMVLEVYYDRLADAKAREELASGAIPAPAVSSANAEQAGDEEDQYSDSEATGNAPPPKKTHVMSVKRAMKNPECIQDEGMRLAVERCITEDDVYSPLIDGIRHSLGIEYECILLDKLRGYDIPFVSEEAMRALGYPKTPDIKLEIPIMVEGCIVNWIESKASFGDEYSHKNYLKDQFWGYHNRYGPGMVIYWFGYIEELDDARDKGIMVRDGFPRTFSILTPTGVRTVVASPQR